MILYKMLLHLIFLVSRRVLKAEGYTISSGIA